VLGKTLVELASGSNHVKDIMKKILAILSVSALVTACGSTDPYQKRADAERDRQERLVDRALDRAPKWMNELPKSNSAVYASGSAVSGDLSMADEKAKLVAYGNICTTAGGEVDKQTRVFRADVGDQSVENSKMAIRSMCRTVDITGAEIVEIKRVSQGTQYRSYVLVALPTGDANPMQQRRDRQRAGAQVSQQADQAFRELDRQGSRRD
jgi:hypothetical protein